MASLFYNEEKNGIEIDFEGEIPDEALRDEMKSIGFKWHKTGKYWYAKQNKKTIALAECICQEYDEEFNEDNEDE